MKNICKWYEKLTKNSKFDKENQTKKQKTTTTTTRKKKPSYSQRQGQYYDIYI